MRERFLQSDAKLSGFAPHEVLELLLYYAIPRVNVNPLAHRLMDRFGSVNAILSASVEELHQIKGISKSGAVMIMLIRRLMNYMNLESLGEKPFMRNISEARAYCARLFADAGVERFYLICLDAQARVTNAVLLSTGTINEVSVYPREVIGMALRYDAHHVVLAHNHPSGVLEPSKADIEMTELLRDAFSKVDMLLQDHIIYADGQCLSYAKWISARDTRPKLTRPRTKAAEKSPDAPRIEPEATETP